MAFKRPPIIRPPSEWKSYYLPITRGCSNNTCTFCGYYGSKLRLRPLHEVKQEIDALALYKKNGIFLPSIPRTVYEIGRIWSGKRVFLQDGDALIYPFSRLKEILEYLNDKFPDIERIGTYATPQDILRRDINELRELKRLRLDIFYQGIESGDDDVLQRVEKGANYSQIVKAGRKAKEAGIALSVTVILGLGGVKGSCRHALETARILTEVDPDYGGALTLTLVPGTPLYDEWKRGKFSLLSPFEALEELAMIIANSSFSHCFFSSMHASNYFSIRGMLPQEKERILEELRDILTKQDLSLLRPDHLRGL
ncbi:MAG: radical SAM protein [Thermodesulfobacteriota bacterium]|nr:radical SAM protein [Thermodesulfobacteriota bacterium]